MFLKCVAEYANDVNSLVTNHSNQLENGINWNVYQDSWKGNWTAWWFDPVIDYPFVIPLSGNSPKGIGFVLHILNALPLGFG